MAKMCPIDACSKKPGLCIHEKMMIVLGVVGIAVAVWFAAA